MNRFSFAKTCLVAGMIGFASSAWAGIAVASSDPEQNTPILSLSEVMLTFDTMEVVELDNGALPVMTMTKDVVGYMDFEYGDDGNQVKGIVYDLEGAGRVKKTLEEDGVYVINIPAGKFYEEYERNPCDAFTLKYIVEAPKTSESFIKKAEPEKGGEVDKLESFKVLFLNADYQYSDVQGEIRDASGAKVASFSMDCNFMDGDWWKFDVAPAVTAAGTYTVFFPEGAIVDSNYSPVGTDQFTYVVKGGSEQPGPVEPEKLTYTISPNPGTLSYENGHTIEIINLQFPAGTSYDPTWKPVFVKDGTDRFEGRVIDFSNMQPGAFIMRDFSFPEKGPRTGEYVMTIPAGTFKKGDVNCEEIVLTYNYIENPFYDGNDDDPNISTPFELKEVFISDKADRVDETFHYNLLDSNAEFEKWGRDTYLHIKTNKNDLDKVTALTVTIKDADDQSGELLYNRWTFNNYQGIAGNTFNGKDGEGYFVFNNASDVEFFKNHNYIITIEAYNQYDGIPDNLRVSYGKAEATFKGKLAEFVYSDAKIVSVTPEPDSEITELGDVPVVVTYSKPVEVNPSFCHISLGQMGSIGFKSVTSNEDKTVWTFVISQSSVEMGALDLVIGVKDLDGHPVRPAEYDEMDSLIKNGGYKDNSCQMWSYTTHLDGFDFDIQGGAVEEIYDFTFEYQSKAIGFNVPASGEIPTLQTMTGAVVAKMDVEHYETVEGVYQGDPSTIAIKMHLEEKVTKPGRYVLVVPGGCFITGAQFDTQGNKPLRVEYTIAGERELDMTSVKEGEAVKALGIVAYYVFEPAKVKADAQMHLRRAGSTREEAAAPLQVAKAADSYMVFADFSDASTGYAPRELKGDWEYELSVNDGDVLTESGDAFKGKTVKFRGQAAGHVALTSEIAGHAASVTKVAKGETATVALTPAEGWKVEKVELDGKDVTADVAAGSYTTPALNADAKLVATYKFDGELKMLTGTGVAEIGTGLKVYIDGSEIVVDGVNAGQKVAVYSLGGTLMDVVEVKDGNQVRISVDLNTCIVVVDGKQAVKIVK